LDDRRKDGGTNSTLRTKEQGTHLTLNEHDDDDEKYISQHYTPDQHNSDINKGTVYAATNILIAREIVRPKRFI
jgi:hypothetical protein